MQRVDLGSLLVAPSEGRELRMQVDEKTGTVQAVMIAAEDGALELQVFAAPRGGDLWSTVRPQIQADITRRGGKAEEREGREARRAVRAGADRTAAGEAVELGEAGRNAGQALLLHGLGKAVEGGIESGSGSLAGPGF